MKLRLFAFVSFLIVFSNSYAQDTTNVFGFELKKLKPIVQIFGTADYDIENNNYGYSFGRTHLGLQYQFNEKWIAKIIIDSGRATSVGEITVTDANGNSLTVQNNAKEGAYYTMFLKFASLQWKVNNKLSMEGGAILQNHYITQERFWGFRYVAQTFQDLYWKIPSSDLGFIANYKFNNIVSVDAAITNGEGPRVEQDMFGNIKFAGGIDINPPKKIQTRIFYHNRHSVTDSEKNEQLFSAFIGYKPNEIFRIGGEFNYMANLNNVPELDSYGFSFYSAYHVVENTQLFVRYDRLLYDMDKHIITNMKGDGNTIIGGISLSPVSDVNISLNYQRWMPDKTENKQENNILVSMEYKF